MLQGEDRLRLHAGVTDNAAVAFHPGRVPSEGIAMTEARNGTIRISRADLGTAGRIPLDDAPCIKGALQTAHAARIPSGEIVNLHPDVPSGTIQVRRTTHPQCPGWSRTQPRRVSPRLWRRYARLVEVTCPDRRLGLHEWTREPRVGRVGATTSGVGCGQTCLTDTPS